jgi:hypothetical protein
MQKLSRREALRGTGVAAIAAGAAVVPLVGACAAGGGELAGLIRLYFQQVDEFNATPHETDEWFNAHAASTFQATLSRMHNVPIRSADDALAFLDFLEREELIEDFCGELDGMVSTSIGSLRRYIAEEVRS